MAACLAVLMKLHTEGPDIVYEQMHIPRNNLNNLIPVDELNIYIGNFIK